jgi:hypothetical protein
MAAAAATTAKEVEKKMELMKEVLLDSPLLLHVLRLASLFLSICLTLKETPACIIRFDL